MIKVSGISSKSWNIAEQLRPAAIVHDLHAIIFYFVANAQLKRDTKLRDLMNAIGITGFGGPVGKNCFAFCATPRFLVVIFHFISLGVRLAIFIALATIAEKYWNVRVLWHFAKCVLGHRGKIDFLRRSFINIHASYRGRNEELRIFCSCAFYRGKISKLRRTVIIASNYEKFSSRVMFVPLWRRSYFQLKRRASEMLVEMFAF